MIDIHNISYMKNRFLLLLQLKLDQERDRENTVFFLPESFQTEQVLQITADRTGARPTAAGFRKDTPVEVQAAGLERIRIRNGQIRNTGPTQAGRLLLRMMARWRPARAVLEVGACL